MSISSTIESKRMILRYWTKGARQLYKACGIYTVYSKDGNCLYVGQSVDLGKRVLRFFKPREGTVGPRTSKPIRFTLPDKSVETWHGCYVEVTTIQSKHRLDSFERTMIAIYKPIYNQLLKYKD